MTKKINRATARFIKHFTFLFCIFRGVNIVILFGFLFKPDYIILMLTYDNAVSENFFNFLKCEPVNHAGRGLLSSKPWNKCGWFTQIDEILRFISSFEAFLCPFLPGGHIFSNQHISTLCQISVTGFKNNNSLFLNIIQGNFIKNLPQHHVEICFVCLVSRCPHLYNSGTFINGNSHKITFFRY